MGQSSCIYCPAGYLCDTANLQAPNDCDPGYYCPAQTSSVSNEKIACPAGTYNDRKNIGSVEACTPCPVGKWCAAATTAESAASDCDAGFFCPYGSSAANGYTTDYEFGKAASGKCPAGYTCAAATIAPTPCPVGQFQAVSGSTTCDDCTGGYYCDEVGMSVLDDNQKCDAGYYCTTASDIPNPVGLEATKGDIC